MWLRAAHNKRAAERKLQQREGKTSSPDLTFFHELDRGGMRLAVPEVLELCVHIHSRFRQIVSKRTMGQHRSQLFILAEHYLDRQTTSNGV